MAKAIDVANFFIDLVNKVEDEPMTNMRINKMLYFAQAYSLVRLGKPLFPEDIQAWKYGPVVKTVYNTFKCMPSSIQSISGEYSSDVFSDEEIALLLDVEREFGRFTTYALSDITHQEGSPWKEVYRPNELEAVIPIERMRDYFSQLPPLPEFKLSYSSADVIGFHDEEGHLVLPKEDDDDDYSSE